MWDVSTRARTVRRGVTRRRQWLRLLAPYDSPYADHTEHCEDTDYSETRTTQTRMHV